MSTTVIWAPLTYRATIVRLRKRLSIEVPVFEEMPVEIPVRDGSEAPISLRMRGTFFPVKTNDVREYRSYGGRCWRPLRSAGPDARPLDVEGFVQELGRLTSEEIEAKNWQDAPWAEARNSRARVRMYEEPVGRAPAREQHLVRRWIKDNRAEVHAAARALAAKSLMIIDGGVWCVTDEPSWMFSLADAAPSVEASVQAYAPFTLSPRPHPARAHLRIDRWDEVAKLLSDRGATAVRRVEVEMVRPELLTFDEREAAARRFIYAASDFGCRSALRETPDTVLEDLTRLDQMVDEMSGPDFPGVEAIERLRSIQGQLKRDDPTFNYGRMPPVLDEIVSIESSFAPAATLRADEDALISAL